MQVLYLDVMPGAGLDAMLSLVEAARERLAQAGIESTDDRDFTPHVTIAKMSKVRSRRRGKQPVCKGISKVSTFRLVCHYQAKHGLLWICQGHACWAHASEIHVKMATDVQRDSFGVYRFTHVAMRKWHLVDQRSSWWVFAVGAIASSQQDCD